MGQDAALDTLSQITVHKVREDYGDHPSMRFIVPRMARNEPSRRVFVSVWERQDKA